MNFWKRLRLIGNIVLLSVAILVVVTVLLRATEAISPISSGVQKTEPTPKSGTTGL
jgi:cytochrome c oxidase subunit IV